MLVWGVVEHFDRSAYDPSLCPATRLCLSSRVNSAHLRNTYFLLAGHTRTARVSVLDLDSAPPHSLLGEIPRVNNQVSAIAFLVDLFLGELDDRNDILVVYPLY